MAAAAAWVATHNDDIPWRLRALDASLEAHDVSIYHGTGRSDMLYCHFRLAQQPAYYYELALEHGGYHAQATEYIMDKETHEWRAVNTMPQDFYVSIFTEPLVYPTSSLFLGASMVHTAGGMRLPPMRDLRQLLDPATYEFGTLPAKEMETSVSGCIVC